MGQELESLGRMQKEPHLLGRVVGPEEAGGVCISLHHGAPGGGHLSLLLGDQGYEASDFFAKASRWPDDMAKVPLDQPMGSMLPSGQVVGRPGDGCSSVSSSGGLRGTCPAQPIGPVIPSQFIGDGLPDSCSSVSPLPVKKRVGVAFGALRWRPPAALRLG